MVAYVTCENYPPSRAWDQFELNTHHDYLDLKRELMTCSEEKEPILWNRIARLSAMTRAGAKARAAGADPLHWRLGYRDD